MDEKMSLSPSVGWIYHNPDTGIEFSEDHPVKSGMVDDATHIRPATAENLKSALLDAWTALDEHRSAEGDWMRKCFDARTDVERLTKERDAEHEDALEKNRLWGIQCEKVAKFEHERAALEARAQSAEAEVERLKEENARMETELAEAQRDKDLAEFHAREMNEACGKLELERDEAISRAQSAEAELDKIRRLASTGTAANFLLCDDETKKGVFAHWVDESARRKQAEAEIESRDNLIKDHLRKIMHLENRIEEEACRADTAESALAEMREAALKTEIALENLHALVWGESPSLLNEDSGGSAHLDIACRDALNALRALMEKGGDNGDGNA